MINIFSGAFSSVQILLKHGGYFIGSLLKSHGVYEAYLYLAKNEKYSEYLQDVHNFIPPTYYEKNPLEPLEKLFKEQNFDIVLLEHKKDVYDFETKSNFKSKRTEQKTQNK